jgi:5-(carboxyamino)imidazole ribonucleotide synthase
MLGLAGLPLGHSFTFLDPAGDACAAEVGDLLVADYDDPESLGVLAARSDVVTFEFENVDVGAASDISQDVAFWPPPQSLAVAQDRLAEKRAFQDAGLDVATYAAASDPDELRKAIDRVGTPCLIKSRRQGYDGKGQALIHDHREAEAAWRSIGQVPSLVEAVVPFTRELSIIAVRATTGETVFYPPVENHHLDGILRLSIAPAPDLDSGLRTRAESIAGRTLDRLDHVGALAIELFQADGELLGNEMAPRVHNSGHYSIEGAETSQFENHIRAVSGAPLGPTRSTGPAVMVNLIGEVPSEEQLLEIPHAHLHLYGKEPRPGRKVGHVTLAHAEFRVLASSLETLVGLVEGVPEVSLTGDAG